MGAAVILRKLRTQKSPNLERKGLKIILGLPRIYHWLIFYFALARFTWFMYEILAERFTNCRNGDHPPELDYPHFSKVD